MLRRRQLLLRRAVSAVLLVLVCSCVGAAYLALKPTPATPSAQGEAARLPAARVLPAPGLSEQDLGVIWRGRDPRTASLQPVAPITPEPSTDPQGLPFKLRGIVYSTAGDSVAFVERDGEVVLFSAGDTVDGWVVSVIDAGSITLAKDGVERVLGIESRAYAADQLTAMASARGGVSPERGGAPATQYAARAAGGRGSAAVDSAQPAGLTPRPQPRLAGGVDARVAVPRDLVDAVRKDPTSVEYGISYSADVGRDGKVQGYRIDSVKAGSLAARYGLAPGDKIVAVNDLPVDSPASVVRIYQRYLNSNSATVKIERGGEVKEVTYYVR